MPDVPLPVAIGTAGSCRAQRQQEAKEQRVGPSVSGVLGPHQVSQMEKETELPHDHLYRLCSYSFSV